MYTCAQADKGAHSIGLNWGNKSIIPQAEAGEVDQYFYSDGCAAGTSLDSLLKHKGMQLCTMFVPPVDDKFQPSRPRYYVSPWQSKPHPPIHWLHAQLRLHPGPGGARVMAELMIHPLAVAVEEVAEGVQVEERQDPRLQGLPPPMIPHSPSIASSACYMLEEFKPLVKKAQGFLYRPERPARTSVLAQKWGWSGLQPGEWLQLEVSTMLEAASPQRNATVLLTHLHGNEGLGSAALSCTSGCVCEPAVLRAWEPPIPYTVFLNYPLHNVTQHPRCRLRVEIMNERPQQAEQKVRCQAGPSAGHAC
jgi:hypothetical protein